MHHSCCSTYTSPLEWEWNVVHTQHMCNIPSCTNHHSGHSSCWVLEISYHIPFTTAKVMEAHEGEHLFIILVYEFQHKSKKAGMCVIKVSFSQARIGFIDQRCGETPQFLTTEWDVGSSSFRWRSLLPATYSTIHRYILDHIVHL